MPKSTATSHEEKKHLQTLEERIRSSEKALAELEAKIQKDLKQFPGALDGNEDIVLKHMLREFLEQDRKELQELKAKSPSPKPQAASSMPSGDRLKKMFAMGLASAEVWARPKKPERPKNSPYSRPERKASRSS